MKKINFILIIVLSAAYIAGCKKDTNDDNTVKGDIHALIPDSILIKIKSMGMIINSGSTPPNIEKIYLLTPFVLKATNIPFDSPVGSIFADYHVKFYQQDNNKLTVKMDYLNGPETGTGLGSIISGSDSLFTVAAKISGLNGTSDSASLVQVLSGTVVAGAIKNLHVAFFMLDNYSNINHYWIEEGQGRIFYDSDGVSPESVPFKSFTPDNRLWGGGGITLDE